MFLYFRIMLGFDEEDGSNRFYFFRNCTHFGNLPLSQDSQLIQTFKHKVNNPQISWFISLNLIFILALASLLWWRNDCSRAAKCALCGGCDLRLRFVLCCATGDATPELRRRSFSKQQHLISTPVVTDIFLQCYLDFIFMFYCFIYNTGFTSHYNSTHYLFTLDHVRHKCFYSVSRIIFTVWFMLF